MLHQLENNFKLLHVRSQTYVFFFGYFSVSISLLRLREKDKEKFEGKRRKDNNIMEIQDAKKKRQWRLLYEAII
jgi:hypothetical protein